MCMLSHQIIKCLLKCNEGKKSGGFWSQSRNIYSTISTHLLNAPMDGSMEIKRKNDNRNTIWANQRSQRSTSFWWLWQHMFGRHNFIHGPKVMSVFNELIQSFFILHNSKVPVRGISRHWPALFTHGLNRTTRSFERCKIKINLLSALNDLDILFSLLWTTSR